MTVKINSTSNACKRMDVGTALMKMRAYQKARKALSYEPVTDSHLQAIGVTDGNGILLDAHYITTGGEDLSDVVSSMKELSKTNSAVYLCMMLGDKWSFCSNVNLVVDYQMELDDLDPDDPEEECCLFGTLQFKPL